MVYFLKIVSSACHGELYCARLSRTRLCELQAGHIAVSPVPVRTDFQFTFLEGGYITSYTVSCTVSVTHQHTCWQLEEVKLDEKRSWKV